jgi:large subunit ribosomal protein L31
MLLIKPIHASKRGKVDL